jgi:hypothetical protein
VEYVAWSFGDIGVSLSDDVDETFFCEHSRMKARDKMRDASEDHLNKYW